MKHKICVYVRTKEYCITSILVIGASATKRNAQSVSKYVHKISTDSMLRSIWFYLGLVVSSQVVTC